MFYIMFLYSMSCVNYLVKVGCVQIFLRRLSVTMVCLLLISLDILWVSTNLPTSRSVVMIMTLLTPIVVNCLVTISVVCYAFCRFPLLSNLLDLISAVWIGITALLSTLSLCKYFYYVVILSSVIVSVFFFCRWY
jgi:hypothetical protein